MVLHSRRHGRIAMVRFVLLAFHCPACVRRFPLPRASPVVGQLEFSSVCRTPHRVTGRIARRCAPRLPGHPKEGEGMTPNQAHSLDGGIPLLPTIQHYWPAASDEHRWPASHR
jgi:hypothetical protein